MHILDCLGFNLVCFFSYYKDLNKPTYFYTRKAVGVTNAYDSFRLCSQSVLHVSGYKVFSKFRTFTGYATL